MFLGIDIGTTSTKAVLIDANQAMIAAATGGYAESEPARGRNEIDPRLWIDAVRSVVGQLRRSVPRELCATSAVGLSGQMHTLVTLDRHLHPVRPAILWSDGRGEEESRLLR